MGWRSTCYCVGPRGKHSVLAMDDEQRMTGFVLEVPYVQPRTTRARNTSPLNKHAATEYLRYLIMLQPQPETRCEALSNNPAAPPEAAMLAPIDGLDRMGKRRFCEVSRWESR